MAMQNAIMTNSKTMMGPPRETHAEFLQPAQDHKPQQYRAYNKCRSNIEILVTQKLYNIRDYIHSVPNIRHYQNHFSHQDMHNITKLHCTQYTHYTVSPKLTQVQVTQTCRYNKTAPFCSLEALPLFKQFQHVDIHGH
jgi:hypothetical protein